MSNDYLNEDYHKQLAQRYDARKTALDNEKMADVLKQLGFDIDAADIKKTVGGNVSGTFFAGDFVVKIQSDRKRHEFLANQIVSEKLGEKNLPIVKVLAYDHFENTDYEVLVMQKGQGKMLLEDFYRLSNEQQAELFGQLFEVINQVSAIEMPDFGEIRLGQHFESFEKYLVAQFENYQQIILNQKLAEAKDIRRISDYIYENIDIFNDDKIAYFNHTDLHTGNLLYDGEKLTLLFDFDGAIKGPRYLILPKLIGAIDDPSQFVEGTEYFAKYQCRKFDHLYKPLKEKMPEILAIPNLVRKLNIYGIIEGLKWISENWSAEWNANQIKNLLEIEMTSETQPLEETYYGKIFRKIA